MTPSEAFSAWIDGKRVEVRWRDQKDWLPVARFHVDMYGLTVEYDNAVNIIKCNAVGREFRLKDAAPALSTVSPHNDTSVAYRAGQADSEAWGLLLEIHGLVTSGKAWVYPMARVDAALKKAGKL